MGDQYNLFQKVFRVAVNTRHPQDYPQIIEGLLKYDNELWRSRNLISLSFILFDNSPAQFVGTLNHKNPMAPGLTRDARFLAWFQACESAGAGIKQALERSVEDRCDFSESLKPLIRSRATQTMLWWRQRGLDEVIFLPGSGKKTNLETLAFYHGQDEVTRTLISESGLEHLDILWSRVWHGSNLHRSDRMADLLLQYGPPPSDFLEKLPAPAINKRNSPAVIGMVRRLVSEGHCDISKSQATHELTRIVKNLRSPAGLDLVEMYLDYGASPIGLKNTGPLSIILATWPLISLKDVLQESYRKCVELLLDRATQQEVDTVLTPTRIKRLVKCFEDKRPNTGYQSDQDQEVALRTNLSFLRRVALGQITRNQIISSTSPKSLKI